MTRRVKYDRNSNKFLSAPRLSIMSALETAVLLLEQSGATEEDIMRLVHLICAGLIRDGGFTPEYMELAQAELEARRREEEMQERLDALRNSVVSSTEIATDWRA